MINKKIQEFQLIKERFEDQIDQCKNWKSNMHSSAGPILAETEKP